MIKLSKLNEKVLLYGSPAWIVNTITKEDLERFLDKEEIKKIDDDEMFSIAEKLGDVLME